MSRGGSPRAHCARSTKSARSRLARATIGVALAAFASLARAAFLSGETLDKAADIVAIIVLIVVPVVVIVVFWLVHVLPERIAEKRHHPQTAAIQTLCLLSLFFGGLLWPLAWLWAYTKPVAYRMAYGTDKADTYHEELGEKAREGALMQAEIEHLRRELDTMAARGALTPSMQRLREDLAAVIAKDADLPSTPGGRA